MDFPNLLTKFPRHYHTPIGHDTHSSTDSSFSLSLVSFLYKQLEDDIIPHKLMDFLLLFLVSRTIHILYTCLDISKMAGELSAKHQLVHVGEAVALASLAHMF